jgi:hypothetical protein
VEDLAAVLLKRDGPGDPGRARTLLKSARGAYRELHMHAWAARCDELEYGSPVAQNT